MRSIKVISFFTGACWLIASRLAAQTMPADTAGISSALAYAKTIYTEKINARATALSGAEFPVYKDKVEHPFFESVEAQKGDIVYDGLRINNVDMLYDIQHDQVVVRYPDSPLRFVIDPNRVERFMLDGHTFRRFAADSTLSAGFYDVLFEKDAVQLLAKRVKIGESRIVDAKAVTIYEKKDNFFLLTGDQVQLIKSKKDILLLKPAEKKRLSSYLKSKKLKFKRDKEAYVLAAVHYINAVK